MNKSIICFLAISLFITACNNTKTNTNDSVIDSLSNEQNDARQITDEAVAYITESGIESLDFEDIFTLDMYGNDNLPSSFNGWYFMTENLVIMEEGVEYDNLQLSLVDDGKDIAVDDNYGIHIYNNTIKTIEGIACGNTIEELFEAYPENELFYSYVSDQIRFYSLDSDNIVFILNNDDIVSDKDLIESDYIQLTKEDIKNNAEIIEILVLR